MSLSTLQLASTSALALLAGSANAPHDQSIILDAEGDLESHRLTLDLNWKTRRTVSDVLTDLVDIDGISVVADRHFGNRPDVLALRHDWDSVSPFHLYCATGIDRAVYLDSRTMSPTSPLSMRRRRSVGVMAEIGASWRLTQQFNVEADVHWLDLTRNAPLVRTDAGWGSGNPAALRLSLVWRGK